MSVTTMILDLAMRISLMTVFMWGLGHLIIAVIHLYDRVFTSIMTFFKVKKLFVQFIYAQIKKERERAARE